MGYCPIFKLATFVVSLFGMLSVQAAQDNQNPMSKVPFSREISLIGGISQSSGPGVERSIRPASGFIYARSFTLPEPNRFLIRVIADTIWTDLTTSYRPLSQLAPERKAVATLIRFGFSGCYLWSTTWMACMDDGPRISWLNQGTSDAQVLGSFPLGVSVHNGELFPWILSLRGEIGRWQSREKGVQFKNDLSLLWLGAGYNW